ncbi:hypothetical protein KR038_004954 [Drosophila bunnanda]|nr:hypothetical protein KR038_004954 [Drosophila bunnanda]
MSDGINAILIKCPKDSAIDTCEPQLIINIHMNPSVDLNNVQDSWILDEVYDPTKRSISKIISPYLIVIGRGEPVVMYPLQYEEVCKNNFFIKKYLPEYAKVTENMNKGSNLIQEINPEHGKVPEQGRKQEYNNAQTTKNIYKGYGIRQGRVSEHEIKNKYYNGMTPDNIYTVNELPTKGVPEYDRKNYYYNVNEYYNAKPTDNIYKGSDPLKEEVPEFNRKNKYYSAKITDNIYKESDPLKEGLPEFIRKNEYYNDKTTDSIYNGMNHPIEAVPEYERKNVYLNAKATENIYKVSDLSQGSVPENKITNEKYIAKTAENNLYTKNCLPESGLEYDRNNEYYNAKTTEYIYKASLPQERDPECHRKNEYYNAQTTPNYYKGSDIMQERIPELDKKNDFYNAKKTDKGSDLLQERVHNFDRKYNYYNAKTAENSVKEKDLPKGIDLEFYPKNEYYNAKAAENNIDKVYHLFQGTGPEDNIKNVYYNYKAAGNISRLDYPSSREREKFNFNEPVKSHSDINGNPHSKQYDPLNNAQASIPSTNDYPFGQTDIDFIVSQHLRENLQTMPNNLNPKDLYSNLGQSQSYSKFPPNKPYPSDPRTNPYIPESRNYKRMRRSCSPKLAIKSKGPAQYIDDPNPQKEITLQTVEENGEVPCDTCGGKNKKKDDKPPTRFCSALTEPKNSESKMDDSNAQGKLNDVIPCDTCGGKNKKVGGKPLPGGLDSEVHRAKEEIGQQLTSEDMIPCEKCKVNREGNLASQSCGCVSNPSVCNCEGSKLSRAPNQSNGDLTYGVFNMNNPIPYLTTQLRIFRRRHNTWWRIVPIVKIDSVSGIFANKNISMIFSTRIGTLRQEKYARFLNHKLVIPLASDDLLAGSKSLETLTEMQNNLGKGFLIGSPKKDISIREVDNAEEDVIKRIDSLGNFPASMKALQMCPNNDKNLCLNIRGERVPGNVYLNQNLIKLLRVSFTHLEFSIKVKIPFRENAFMVDNRHVIKIASIVTDATTKDALHISIDVINKGLEAHEYSIYVYNCPLSKSALSTTSIRRQLLPDIGQSVIFLLPFINGAKKNKKFSCDVVVKESDLNNSNKSLFMKSSDLKDGIIAKRSMDIRVHSRCFCIARCRCHCMEKLQTFIKYNICERMSRRAEEEAGLIYNCPPGNEKNDVCITDLSCDTHKKASFNIFSQIHTIILIILIWLLMFGLLKAIFGLCIKSIDRWGFETVQPGRYYACTSRIRIFIVNVFFFIIYPFTCWCKCFKPRPEDLMAASTDWSCNHEMFDDECPLSENKDSKSCRLRGGGHAQKLSENLLRAFSPHYENGLFKDDKPDDEESTAFILEVLEESKTSLSRMVTQSCPESPEIVSKRAENSEEDRTAGELVENLKSSQRAYRIMNSPVGGVINIPENCQYCVKGFFLPTIKGTYEFISYHPLVQYISISKENEVVKLKKPEYLHTEEFSRNYANKLEVLKAGDLSVGCPPNVPCINITPLNDLESSFVKLSELLKETHSD